MRIFIAGIMQGSLPGVELHGQDYRQRIGHLLMERYPQAQIVDPWIMHPESPSYDDERGKQTFLEMIEEAEKADLLIAYLPEASMGTALEMWGAYQAGVSVITISPLGDNWAVKFLSSQVFATWEEFEAFVGEGGLEELRGLST